MPRPLSRNLSTTAVVAGLSLTGLAARAGQTDAILPVDKAVPTGTLLPLHVVGRVVALGANDFSTSLDPGDRWADRDALHADYEHHYVAFVGRLRKAYPQAFFVLWATDLANGEIAREVGKVTETLREDGERRVAFIPVNGLSSTGYDSHPSVADDTHIAAAIERTIDAQTDIWAVH